MCGLLNLYACLYLLVHLYVRGAVLRHAVEVDNDVVAGLGVAGGAHRIQLGILAAADRNADIHAHRAQVQHQERRHAVRATVPGHVPVAGARLVRVRLAERAAADHADRVQEGLEHGVHVGRCRGPGRTRLHA